MNIVRIFTQMTKSSGSTQAEAVAFHKVVTEPEVVVEAAYDAEFDGVAEVDGLGLRIIKLSKEPCTAVFFSHYTSLCRGHLHLFKF